MEEVTKIKNEVEVAKTDLQAEQKSQIQIPPK